MIRLRPVALPLAALSLAVLAAVAAAAPPPPVAGDAFSVASADAGPSLLLNPAALGVRYPAELSMVLTSWDGAANTSAWTGTAGGLGLAYEDGFGDARAWTLGFGSGSEGLRTGSTVTWGRAASGDRYTDQRAGALSRPLPWLSLGAVADHLYEPRVDGARLPRTWTLGLGLRPLALSRPLAHGAGTRLTLTADATLREDESMSRAGVRVTAELEPLPGLVLRASGERGGARVGVTLRNVRGGYGTTGVYDRDQHPVATQHAFSVHAGDERLAVRNKAERRVAVIRAGGALGDEDLGGVSVMGDSRSASHGLHRALEQALDDPDTRGVLLDLRGVQGMAQVEELRPRIAALREAGKPVVAWLEEGGGRAALYLATACDRVVASPEASFAALGLRAERRYYRRLLERWGIRMDRASVGAYKSAYRNFSVDSTPAADREAIERSLDVVQGLFVDAVTADRHMERDRLMPLLDGRAWPSRELAKAGLIDQVGYREDALALVGELCGMGARPRTVRTSGDDPVQREWTVPTRVAVVYASGAIETGRSGNDLLMGPYMGSTTLVEQLERAFRADGVKSVVMRVESPGGSVLASDLIHHAAERLSRETGKPFVVSMGGVAASGGYYIASGADCIFADRFTVTGSIGVLFVKPSLEGWYAKHDVRQDVFERGDAMGGWSQGRDWDAAMQAAADSSVRDEYRSFVALVARDRKMSEAEVDSVAQGRVWYGEDALARGLIDRIGGFADALADARRRGGIPSGERIRVREFRRPTGGFLERLIGGAVRATLEREARLPELDRAMIWDDLEAE